MISEDIITAMPQELVVNTGETFEDPEANILLDDIWAREVGKEDRLPTIRVWRHAPIHGLVVSKRDVAGEAGERAIKEMANLGCKVIVRPTGGTAVPHGDGVLNLSLLLPRRQEKSSTDLYYRLLCQPMIEWFTSLGLNATTGALPGSYCDGNYNVLVDGLKVVGTAQAWRGGLAGTKSRHPGYVLAHACIVVQADMDVATKEINQFYALIGDTYRVNGETSTTLAERLRLHGLKREYSATQAQQDFSQFLKDYYQAFGLRVSFADF